LGVIGLLLGLACVDGFELDDRLKLGCCGLLLLLVGIIIPVLLTPWPWLILGMLLGNLTPSNVR
jgi:hypothetical protein